MDTIRITMLLVAMMVAGTHTAFEGEANHREEKYDIRNLDLDGEGNELDVSAGETVTLTVDYHDSTGTDYQRQMIVGVRGKGQGIYDDRYFDKRVCIYDGNPPPEGVSGTASFDLVTPANGGTLKVDWVMVSKENCEAGKDNYLGYTYANHWLGEIRAVKPETPPTAAFTFSMDLSDRQGDRYRVTFDATASSAHDGAMIHDYSWDFKDPGVPYHGEEVVVKYLPEGTRDVTLTIQDTDGQRDKATQRVTISPPRPEPSNNGGGSSSQAPSSPEGDTQGPSPGPQNSDPPQGTPGSPIPRFNQDPERNASSEHRDWARELPPASSILACFIATAMATVARSRIRP